MARKRKHPYGSGLRLVQAWCESQGADKRFNRTQIIKGIGARNVTASAVASALKTLETRGVIECTTPGKTKFRYFRHVKNGTKTTAAEPKVLSRLHAKLDDVLAKAEDIEARVGILESHILRMLREWGVEV